MPNKKIKKIGIGKRAMDTPAEREALQKMMQMNKMTPQQKYNFLHDDGYYDESDTGAMTEEERRKLRRLGN